MPDGVLRWFDPAHGDAEVVRGGHAYHVPVGSIDAAARRPGARVHFDVRRVDGAEQAVDVHLRLGAQASRHRRRFGTMEGARRSDTKGPAPYARAHPEVRLGALHPVELARSWATSVARGDLAFALSLYAPGATVHVDERALSSGPALADWLQSVPAFGCERHARIVGTDDGAVVTWEAEVPGEREFALRSRMAHGEIAEQWQLAEAAAAVPLEEGEGLPPLSTHTAGVVDEHDVARARGAVARIVAGLSEPVLFSRVKLVREPDPARVRPARAEAMLDVDGEPVRAHAAARTMAEAIDALEHRLRDQLEHRARRREDLHRATGVARPGEWRHADLAAARPPFFPRPVEDRQLLRHKSFAIGELSPDEAVFDMDQLDYDFYLFVDLASGIDSLMERTDDGALRMTRLQPSTVGLAATAQPVELGQSEVPVLSVSEAIERLGASGEHRLFFADAASGRGAVLYLRYDGNYGLIVPE